MVIRLSGAMDGLCRSVLSMMIENAKMYTVSSLRHCKVKRRCKKRREEAKQGRR
jgi:hypothetical protein